MRSAHVGAGLDSSRLLGLSFKGGRCGVGTPRPQPPPLLLQSLHGRSSRRRRGQLFGIGAIVAAGTFSPPFLRVEARRSVGHGEAGVAERAKMRRAKGVGSSTVYNTRRRRRHRARSAGSRECSWLRGPARSQGPGWLRRGGCRLAVPNGRWCVLLSRLRELSPSPPLLCTLFHNPPLGAAAVVLAPRCIHVDFAVASSNRAGGTCCHVAVAHRHLMRNLF